jgi:hypothetical protein
VLSSPRAPSWFPPLQIAQRIFPQEFFSPYACYMRRPFRARPFLCGYTIARISGVQRPASHSGWHYTLSPPSVASISKPGIKRVATATQTSPLETARHCCVPSGGSVVGCGAMLKARRSRVQFPMWSLDFSVDLILPVPLWP